MTTRFRFALSFLLLLAGAQRTLLSQTITSVDVQAEINKRLAEKGDYHKQHLVQKKKSVCVEGCAGHGCDADTIRCHEVTESVAEVFSEPLHITSFSLQVVDKELTIDPRHTVLPEKLHFHETEVVNCSSVSPQTELTTLQVQVTTSRTIQMTRTVTHAEQLQAGLKYNFGKVGGANVQLTGTDSVQLAEMKAQTKTDAITESHQVNVVAPPLTRSVVSLQVVEGGVQGVFRGRILVDGPVDANLDGITAASQLLTPEERTIEVEGNLTVTSASNARIVQRDKKLTVAECEAAAKRSEEQ